MDDRLGFGPDEEPIEEADPDLFKAIVNGVVDHQAKIDEAIRVRLAEGLEAYRALMPRRARSCGQGRRSFLIHEHLSNAVIMDEYVSLAHDFFDGSEPKFVNGVLEKMGKDLRGA